MRALHAVMVLAALLASTACASAPVPVLEPEPVASAVPIGSDLCYLTVAEAVSRPDLEVDRVPAPLKQDPPPFKPPYPRGVFGKGGTMEIAIEVLVDTLGKADMGTFKVVKTSHQWFATRMKAAVAQWKFEPAIKSGCRVPRIYKLAVTAAAKGSNSKPKPPPKKKA